MGPVVVDTNILVRAILSPTGARRKLWLLLVYGGVVERIHRFGEEQRAAEERGVTIGRVPAIEEATAHIAALLPPGAPDGWWALASPPLLDEYHRKLHALRVKLAKSPLTAELVDDAHRLVIASCGYVTDDFDLAELPMYTEGRDRDDDVVVHTAMLGRASILLSDNTRDLSLDPGGTTEYRGEDGHAVRAMTFEHFVHAHLDMDLDEIDGSLLAEAYGSAR